MTESSKLERAHSLLRDAYGRRDVQSDQAAWPLFLRTLLGIDARHPASSVLTELLSSSALASPRETVSLSAGQIVELLQPIPRGAQKASVVRGLAEWWVDQFGDSLSPEWPSSIESYRISLRQIRGLGPATVDELLLFAAGRPVFPVDRTAMRVAVRHGWLDLPIEEDDARSLFQSPDRSVSELQELSLLLNQVGAAHCGRVPQCTDCPLQPLLPSGGPINPGGC